MEQLRVEGPVEESGLTFHFEGLEVYKPDAQDVSDWPPPGVHLADFLFESGGSLVIVEVKRYPEEEADENKLQGISDRVFSKFFGSYAAACFWKGELVPAKGILVIAFDGKEGLGAQLRDILTVRLRASLRRTRALLPSLKISASVSVKRPGESVSMRGLLSSP